MSIAHGFNGKFYPLKIENKNHNMNHLRVEIFWKRNYNINLNLVLKMTDGVVVIDFNTK